MPGNDIWNGAHFNICMWMLFGLCTPFVAARLYVQFRFRVRPWAELFVIAAWTLDLVNNICRSLMNHLGYWNPDYYHSGETTGPKLNYVQAFVWMISMFACKAALLMFYFELAPRRALPRVWWTNVAVSVFVGIGAAYHILSLFLDCWPYELNWAENAHCNFDAKIILTSMSFHLATDVAVFAVPFLLLHDLFTLSWHDKAGAAAMASLGLFNVIAAAIQLSFYSNIFSNYGRGVTFSVAEYLIVAQPPLAIMIVCAPAIRRLWKGASETAIRAEKEAREEATDAVARRGRDVEDNGCQTMELTPSSNDESGEEDQPKPNMVVNTRSV